MRPPARAWPVARPSGWPRAAPRPAPTAPPARPRPAAPADPRRARARARRRRGRRCRRRPGRGRRRRPRSAAPRGSTGRGRSPRPGAESSNPSSVVRQPAGAERLQQRAVAAADLHQRVRPEADPLAQGRHVGGLRARPERAPAAEALGLGRVGDGVARLVEGGEVACAGHATMVAALSRRRRVALGDLVPVDRVPPRVDVVRALVLVLQVVGVLPHVDAEQRRLAVGDRAVLVRPSRRSRGRSRHGRATPSPSRTGRRRSP